MSRYRPSHEYPAGEYVGRVSHVHEGSNGRAIVMMDVDIPATIRHRLLSRGWKIDRWGHLYVISTTRKVRVVLKARMAYVDVPYWMPDKRGRHKRVIVARAFYSRVAFTSEGGVVIGGHKL